MRTYFAQVEAGFPASKLVDKARVQLGLDTDQAIGKFVRLWLAVLEAGPGGSLKERSDDWIEEAVVWRGERGRFAQFVRECHLNADGSIRDWDEKYGKLEHMRKLARERKQGQRAKTVPPDVTPKSRTRSRTRPVDSHALVTQVVPSDVPPMSRNSSLTSSSSSVAVTQEKEPIPTQEPVGREDPLHAILLDARLALELFPDKDRQHVAGLIRSAKNSLAVACVLRGHLDGDEGPAYLPSVVGRACRDFVAAGHAFNARYFAGFCRDAHAAMLSGDTKRRNANEAVHLSREDVAAENFAREQAESESMVALFRHRRPKKYEQLREIAEKSIDSKIKGTFRAPMVMAALAKLIRATPEATNGED